MLPSLVRQVAPFVSLLEPLLPFHLLQQSLPQGILLDFGPSTGQYLVMSLTCL